MISFQDLGRASGEQTTIPSLLGKLLQVKFICIVTAAALTDVVLIRGLQRLSSGHHRQSYRSCEGQSGCSAAVHNYTNTVVVVGAYAS